MQAFSAEWAAAFHAQINVDGDYAKSGTKWDLGRLALIMDEQAVLLDLHEGECRSASSLPADEAQDQANFVIEGSELVWQDVLAGKIAPLMGIMSGKLKLSKGSIGKLMPFTQAAIDLVGSAQKIETEF